MTTITTNEYTKVVKDWITKAGLRAVILLVRGSHHCGYVQVPEHLGKPDYDDLMDIDVHGGLTYSDNLSQMDNLYVVGYDCAHYMDKTLYNPEGVWRDVDYCTNECESVAQQLVNVKLLN